MFWHYVKATKGRSGSATDADARAPAARGHRATLPSVSVNSSRLHHDHRDGKPEGFGYGRPASLLNAAPF